jgi:hypothetical protein
VHALGRALLAFASAKKQVLWSDYYERDRPAGERGAPARREGPPPPVRAAEAGLDPTRALAAGAPLTPTHTRVREGERPPAHRRHPQRVIPGPVSGTGPLARPPAGPGGG